MGVHGEEVGARRVDARHHQVGADVALVPEEVLLQHGHAGDDAGLAAGREGVELEVGRDDGRGELGVGGGAGAGAPDLGGDVVELLAVLVRYYGTAGRSCVGGDLGGDGICGQPLLFALSIPKGSAKRGGEVSKGGGNRGNGTYHDAAIKYASYDGSTSASRLRKRESSRMEGRIAVVV